MCVVRMHPGVDTRLPRSGHQRGRRDTHGGRTHTQTWALGAGGLAHALRFPGHIGHLLGIYGHFMGILWPSSGLGHSDKSDWNCAGRRVEALVFGRRASYSYARRLDINTDERVWGIRDVVLATAHCGTVRCFECEAFQKVPTIA
jgi:hypothetical protein